MAHFAKVIDGIVTEVLVAERDVIDTGLFGDPALFVQTSYNTHGGQHPDGRPLRKNYAGVGFIYDAERDAFIPPQPLPSWVLNEDTCLWGAPVPYPTDGKPYAWDEASISWVEVVPLEPVFEVEPEAPVANTATLTPMFTTIEPVVVEPMLSTALSTYASTVNE